MVEEGGSSRRGRGPRMQNAGTPCCSAMAQLALLDHLRSTLHDFKRLRILTLMYHALGT